MSLASCAGRVRIGLPDFEGFHCMSKFFRSGLLRRQVSVCHSCFFPHWAWSLVLTVPFAGPAFGNTKSVAPAPPHVSAPHVGGGAVGGVHMPGNMGGGAHIPGNMGGGAHIPGSMGGGAHIPGSMAGTAHIPGNMAGTAHVPGNMAGTAHAPSYQAGTHMAAHTATGVHAGETAGHHGGGETGSRYASNGGVREAGTHEGVHDARISGAGSHGGGTLHGGGADHRGEADHRADADHRIEAGRHDEAEHAAVHHDPRLADTARLHTHGLEAAASQHHEPRAFLHPDPHRDVAHDRSFVEAHKADFHTHDVHAFSARELAAWRGGLWRNEWHYGRRGWWWEVDGVWYPYADPIFPYPLEVAPLVVYDTPIVDGPDLTAEEVVPDAADGQVVSAQPAGIPPLPPAPMGYYRCAQPDGYFPGVGACVAAWDLVPQAPVATPP